jgi:hypothetical protein
MVRWFARRLPALIPGATVHRAGLAALHRGSYSLADALFERAADRYRVDLAIQPLARLRVHQSMARIRAAGSRERERDRGPCLDVEQRLARLERIESLDPPYALVPASSLLATWIAPDTAPSVPGRSSARAA